MAFVNEYVPEKEIRTFEIPPYGRKVTPHRWTVNKEKNTILYNYSTNKDRPNEKHFVFFMDDHIILLTLNCELFVNTNTVKWRMQSISEIPKDLVEIEILNELREAIKVYGCTGSPSQSGCNIIIDF